MSSHPSMVEQTFYERGNGDQHREYINEETDDVACGPCGRDWLQGGKWISWMRSGIFGVSVAGQDRGERMVTWAWYDGHGPASELRSDWSVLRCPRLVREQSSNWFWKDVVCLLKLRSWKRRRTLSNWVGTLCYLYVDDDSIFACTCSLQGVGCWGSAETSNTHGLSQHLVFSLLGFPFGNFLAREPLRPEHCLFAPLAMSMQCKRYSSRIIHGIEDQLQRPKSLREGGCRVTECSDSRLYHDKSESDQWHEFHCREKLLTDKAVS